MTNKTYDIAIIGAGPGGLTAAIYALRSGRSVAIIEKYMVGGQVALTNTIENYPGYQTITGFELSQLLKDQSEKLGAEFIYTEVTDVNFENNIKEIMTTTGKVLAKSVIISTGAKSRKMNIEKEDDFANRGIAYCAVCDGAFYKGKDVALLGGGNAGIEDAIYLSSIAKSVTLIHKYDYFKAQQIIIDEFNETKERNKNVKIIDSNTVTKVFGENALTGIETTNLIDGSVSKFDVDALFVAIGRVPDTMFLKNKINLDNYGYIPTNENMETNVKGVYACGDVRVKNLRQIVTATSDGAIAATTANNYLNTFKE